MRGLLNTQLGGVTTPSAKLVSAAFGVAALVLWGFAGWSWGGRVPLLTGGVVVRLLVWLFFEPWRDWAGPAVLLVVIVFLMGYTTWTADLIAFGVVFLGLAWHLRLASPKWMRWVAVVVGVGMILGGGLTEFVTWANGKAQREEAERLDREFRIAEMRPDGGHDAMFRLIRAVYEDDPFWGCWLFSPAGAAEFAAVNGTSDCDSAIHKLHGQITDRTAFGNSTIPFSDVSEDDGIARSSGCNMYTVTGILEEGPPGGPKLGQLRLEHDPQFPTSGYLITGYVRCGELPPGVTPEEPKPPDILPSYAPGYAATITEAVVDRDADVCVYFTEQGQREFAQAYGVADCAAALAAIAEQVTDPDLYDKPQDAKQATVNGKTTVDACHLTWHKFGSKPGDPPPGPQLGTLTLTVGPRGQGYLIDGYRAC